jgi:hypothetical protein
MNANEVKQVIKDAILEHFEQINHSPGLFLDGYYYRAKHQDSLSLAVSDAATELHVKIEAAINGAVKNKVDEISAKLTAKHASDEN